MATHIRRNLLTIAFFAFTGAAMAQEGTKSEQDACRSDVRHYCYELAPDAGSQIYLQCLQQHRAQLSSRCRAVLDGHGV
ncbi:MAG: hypothetical protein E7774_04250 [Bradyrhizobium sp.]|nr:MAG: hypothetical protein E7774_04250 [Bradyrhizobium sp.]